MAHHITWYESDDGTSIFYEGPTGGTVQVSWHGFAELASAAAPFVGGSHSYTRMFAEGDWSARTVVYAFRDLSKDARDFRKLLDRREVSAQGASSAAEYRSIRRELDADWDSLTELEEALQKSKKAVDKISELGWDD